MHQGMEFFWLSGCGKQTSPLYAVLIKSIRLFYKLQDFYLVDPDSYPHSYLV
ncbi:hypothetical protein BLGI_4308 [Brevibacillus laterosporus GI-9]|nr:hypothetical protein BLGI_4308 [Brevibacillus laterosporus GI-9]